MIVERLLRWVGLDLDFSFELTRVPLSPITDEMHLGTRPGPDRVEVLRAVGLTHVISCLRAEQRSEVEFLKDDFHWLFLPLHDGMDQELDSGLAAAQAFWDEAGLCSPDAKLLVHCEAGVSRSASVLIGLMMRARVAPFYETYLEVRRKRPEILPNIGFASRLQRLEHELVGATSTIKGPSSLARYLKEVCTVPAELEDLDQMLRRYDYDAPLALRTMFDGEIPRVVQGARI